MKPDTRRSARPRKASGRFLLRLDPGLHELLRVAAADAGLSLNDYCARQLAAPRAGIAAAPHLAEAIARAASLFGEALLGVVLFGSEVRDEARPVSDVDLLVVLDRSLPLTRGLYRRWDERAIRFEDRAVEAHLAHLPDEKAELSALWAEVALDGAVLFERGLALSRRLAAMRRELFTGHLQRRSAHGQPYWAGVA